MDLETERKVLEPEVIEIRKNKFDESKLKSKEQMKKSLSPDKNLDFVDKKTLEGPQASIYRG